MVHDHEQYEEKVCVGVGVGACVRVDATQKKWIGKSQMWKCGVEMW